MHRTIKLTSALLLSGLIVITGLAAQPRGGMPAAHATDNASSVEVTLVDMNFDADPVGSLPAPFEALSAGCAGTAVTDELSYSGSHSLRTLVPAACSGDLGWKVTIPQYAPIVGYHWTVRSWDSYNAYQLGIDRNLMSHGVFGSVAFEGWPMSVSPPYSGQFNTYDVVADLRSWNQVVRINDVEAYNGVVTWAGGGGWTEFLSSGHPTHFDDIKLTVTYDGGLATGGGWLNSPAGAYPANPSLTGKAIFGFDARYKDGKVVPEGQVEFQLKAAELNFKADGSYEWLSVSETDRKATFRTTGTINGGGSYGVLGSVLASATNGSPDLVRIKIWDKANGDAVVYDSQGGTSCGTEDYADPCTPVVGGDIKIHK